MFVCIAVCNHLTNLVMPNSNSGDKIRGSQTQPYNILTVNVCLDFNLHILYT